MTEAFDLALLAYAKIMPKSDPVDNLRLKKSDGFAGS